MEGDTASKNPVLEMMDKRNRERKLVNEKNQKARSDKSELEGVDYFDSVFDKKVLEIGSCLDALQPSDSIKIQDDFTAIAKELQDLQRYFTSSTIFLSDHKIQRCQNIINQLVTKSDDTKARLVPKKKFGFKNKAAAVQPRTEAKADGITKASQKEFLWTEFNRRREIIELVEPKKTNNQDLTLKEMEDCIIIIKGHPGSLQMLKMKNCLVLCGPVLRSIFGDSCENCTFAFTCQQLRLHSSTKCDIYMQVTSRAIIEDCREINFASSTYSYDGHEEDLKQSGLDGAVNNWENIGDFNWLSTDKPSPNWRRIEVDQKITDWNEFIAQFRTSHAIP